MSMLADANSPFLCWSRKDEVRSMRWREVDFDACIWRVPAGRMKNKRLHEIPLTKRALEILRTQFHATGQQSLRMSLINSCSRQAVQARRWPKCQ